VAEEHNSEHIISLFRFPMQDLTLAQREEYISTAERLLTLASAMPGLSHFAITRAMTVRCWVTLWPMPDKVWCAKL
jgi:hypothetical protein